MAEADPTRERLFHAAAELADPAQRDAFLAAACAGQPQLRADIEDLLRHDAAAGSFMDRAAELTGAYAGDTRPGTLIGPYKLLQQIGEGGFGVVFMAEQTEPVRRKVALKLIKPGMDTREVIARFESERQALALLDHPNVARVLDAGADGGRPYFVMELVRGVPLTDFCDKNQLPPEGRLELFRAVCGAVQHAHQKGIIHRDLKPSNILVTLHDGRPVPKVIDFGVAKAIDQPLTARTLFTAYGQMVGTPAYMSPEQAEMSGLDIDTRSDIYSLGVILYELLTGTTPLEGKRLRQAGYAEMQRLIREEEPPRPSTRLSSLGGEASVLAGKRGTDVGRLAQMLRGELDWIVMKALDKDRNRRYETASAFAQDVERFLKQEPIQARPPSVVYQVRKFAQRHRSAVLTVAVVLFLLVAGIAGTSLGLLSARRAEQEARREAEHARDAEQRITDHLAQAQHKRDLATAARREAETTARSLQTALAQADSGRLAAQSMTSLATNPGLALLLARAGAEKAPVRSALHNNALLAALQECREERTFFAPARQAPANRTGRTSFIGLQVSRDGRRAVVSAVPSNDPGDPTQVAPDNTDSAYVYDLERGDVTATLRLVGVQFAAMALSPDGRLLATVPGSTVVVRYVDGQTVAYTERAVRLWDLQTGREVRVLTGHTDCVVSLAFDATGERLLTASWDRTARLWDVATGKTLQVLADSPTSLAAAELSLDGRRVLTICSYERRDGPDVAGSRGRTTGSGRPFDVAKTAIDPPVRPDAEIQWLDVMSNFSAYSGSDAALAPRLWDAATGKRLAVLDRGSAMPGVFVFERHAAGFSPDSKRVITVTGQDRLSLWDADDGKHLLDQPDGAGPDRLLKEPGRSLRVVRPAAMGTELWTWQADADGRAWQRFPGASERVRFSWGTREATPHLLAASLAGLPCLAEGRGEMVSVQPLVKDSQAVPLRGHDDQVTAAAFLPGQRLLTAALDGSLRLWNLEPTRAPFLVLKHPLSTGPGHGRFVPGGKYLVTAPLRDRFDHFAGRALMLWDAEQGAFLREISANSARATTELELALLGDLRDFDISPDGTRLVTVHLDANPCTDPKAAPQPSPLYTPVRIWELATGKLLLALPGFRRGVATARFSPDSTRLLTFADGNYRHATVRDGKIFGSGGGGQRWARVDIWDVQTGAQLKTLVPEARGGGSFALWSPDGTRVLTDVLTRPKVAAEILDASSGQRLHQLKVESAVDHAAWSPDGKLVLAYRTLYDRERELAHVWDAGSGVLRATLRGHTGNLTSAELSPDSRSVLTTSTDGTARLWDAVTGAPGPVLRGHRHVVNVARFSPDGRWIATASTDGSARVWQCATGDEWLTLPAGQGECVDVCFRPDSRRLLTISSAGAARLWLVDPLPQAVAYAPRLPTAAERERYQLAAPAR